MSKVDRVAEYGDHIPQCPYPIEGKFPHHYAIQFMAQGSFYFQRGNHIRIETEQPTFFWTERESHYIYGPGKTGYWDHRYIVLHGEMMDSHFLPILEDLAPFGHVAVTNVEHVTRAFEDLTQLLKESNDPFAHLHAINRILARVERGRPGRNAVDPKLQQIKHEIDSSPQTPFDFETVARESGFSYASFRRSFLREFGKAPYAYLTERRMQDAAGRLARSGESVQEIGYFYGYQEPASFSKAFKQYHGISPRAYRETFSIFR